MARKSIGRSPIDPPLSPWKYRFAQVVAELHPVEHGEGELERDRVGARVLDLQGPETLPTAGQSHAEPRGQAELAARARPLEDLSIPPASGRGAAVEVACIRLKSSGRDDEETGRIPRLHRHRPSSC